MFFLPKGFVASLTFPGIIFHEWSHKKFCDWFGVKVYEVQYFSQVTWGGYVKHEAPKSYAATFWISIGPLILNTLIAFIFGAIAAISSNEIISALSVWLSVCAGMHSFPSDADARHIIEASEKRLKDGGNPLHYFAYPLVGLVAIANALRVFWFDLVWALIILNFAFIATGAPSFYRNSANAYENSELVDGKFYCSTESKLSADRLMPHGEEFDIIKKYEAEFDRLDKQLNGLKLDISSTQIDESSDLSVKSYNAKVDEYNSLLRQYKDEHRAYVEVFSAYEKKKEAYNNYLQAHCKRA